MPSPSPNRVRERSPSEASKFRYLPTPYVNGFFSDDSLLFTTYEKCTAYFLKEADPLAIEDEFRFVWTVDHEVRTPTVFRCPEAVEFCVPGRQLHE